MSINHEQVKKIAHLARLKVEEAELPRYAEQLSNILQFVEQINQANTKDVTPMAHPFADAERLRNDVVTEPDQRELFQSIAPQVEAGFYLVPKVIE